MLTVEEVFGVSGGCRLDIVDVLVDDIGVVWCLQMEKLVKLNMIDLILRGIHSKQSQMNTFKKLNENVSKHQIAETRSTVI